MLIPLFETFLELLLQCAAIANCGYHQGMIAKRMVPTY